MLYILEIPAKFTCNNDKMAEWLRYIFPLHSHTMIKSLTTQPGASLKNWSRKSREFEPRSCHVTFLPISHGWHDRRNGHYY
jgi:hypothetical protein